MIKKLIAIVVLILLLWGGYVAYAVITAKPVLEAHWGNVSEDSVEIVVDARLDKPLLLPLGLDNFTFLFNNIEVATLDKFEYSPLSKNLSLVVKINSRNLIRSIERYFDANQMGEVIVDVKLNLLGLIHPKFTTSKVVQQDVLKNLNFTAEEKPILGGLLYTPAVVSTEVSWMGAENNSWNFRVYVTLKNPNSIPLAVSNVEFDIFANGIYIGKGEVSKGVVIPANGMATVPLEVKIRSDLLPGVLAEHIRNGETSTVRADFYITLTAGGERSRIKLVSEEKTIRTHIMESINQILREFSTRE
ncbi:LEA type 2 family protein [Thermococcus sp.]